MHEPRKNLMLLFSCKKICMELLVDACFFFAFTKDSILYFCARSSRLSFTCLYFCFPPTHLFSMLLYFFIKLRAISNGEIRFPFPAAAAGAEGVAFLVVSVLEKAAAGPVVGGGGGNGSNELERFPSTTAVELD